MTVRPSWRIHVKKPLAPFLALLFAISFILALPSPAQAGPKGYLFIIGGGERDAPLMKRYVQLASGFGTGRVVVFTMASGSPQEVGPELVAEFKTNGTKDVVYYQLTHDEAMKPGSEKILAGAGGIWFAGGDQARLTAALLDTPIHKKMLEMYQAGCVIGGTSAGAAVMSEVMITGDEKRTDGKEGTWEVIWADDVIRTRGFGFVRAAVIDQHFVTRRRLNRLIATVIENPTLVGVGIDESTAVLVRPDGRYEVLGENQVVVFDARRAKTAKSPTGRLGAHGMTLHVLLPGDVYDVGHRKGLGAMSLKKLKLPHTLILIYIMVVLTVVATWIIPGGQYKRIEKGGRTIPVAGSYERTASRPQGLGGLFVSPARGLRGRRGHHHHRLHLRRRLFRHPEDRGRLDRHPQPVR